MTLQRRKFLLSSGALVAALPFIKQNALAAALAETTLADTYKNDFILGTAMPGRGFGEGMEDYLALVKKEFRAITMENDMKWERVRPSLDEWNFDISDKFVQFGQDNNMYTVGHVLVWHSQVPDEVFKDSKGKELSKKALKARMAEHIQTIAGRYKGKIDAWDVVNEAVQDGKLEWRDTNWKRIIGPEFMDHAFNTAHEVDPGAHLIYNDYNMHEPLRREFVVNMIRDLKKRGVPIQGIGMQGHIGLNYTDLKEFEKSIIAYKSEGMRVHVTELDVDVLPVAWNFMGAEISTLFEYKDELNPYTEGLPAEISKQLADRYVEFFTMLMRHKDDIDRVTMWGTSDAESWKNGFPVRGRTNYPLLFDREWKRKECYDALVKLRATL